MTTPVKQAPLAVLAAATTWFTMLSWRGFSTDWGGFLGPLLVLALTVSCGGVALRAAPLSRGAGVVVHVLLVSVVVWLVLGGSWRHPFASSHHIGLALRNGWLSTWRFPAPIPPTVASIAPLMIVCGAGALLLVDLLACWLHRAALAGLPLLAVYVAPVIGFGGGVAWLVFAIGAVGFLLMLFLQESARISRWGRPLAATAVDPNGLLVRTGGRHSSAAPVAGVAVVLAVVLPVFIPNLHLDEHRLFGAGGGGGTVSMANPFASMLPELQPGSDVPLLHVTTDNPEPTYLRIAVDTQFDGVRWTPGKRPVLSGQVANGPLPTLEQGLSTTVATKHYHYKVTAVNNYSSPWLPTQFPVSSIVAPGTWHYDRSTMDFYAGDNSETNIHGVTYHMTAAIPQLTRSALTHSQPAPPPIRATYLKLPPALPAKVWSMARRVTRGLTNPYREAVRLQTWFRSTGGFHYSLHVHDGNGSNALVHFLTPGHGGRVGYCQQFASAYAVMARTLDIPARVAVGFLQPTQTRDGDWIYSTNDLHAWPELYFEGSGWVRFEPTPAARTGQPPSYTLRHHRTRSTPTQQVTTSRTISPTTTHTTTSSANQPGHGIPSSTSPPRPIPWSRAVPVLGLTLLVATILAVPGAVRRSRRARRLAGGAEDAWAELRDTAVDLAVDWPGGRSPHETGERLAAWFGPEPEGAPAVRPRRGIGLAPAAESALARIVLMVEQVRYARSANDIPGALADDVRTCINALEHGTPSRTLRRARWVPRSVLSGPPGPTRNPQPDPEADRHRGGVDHVH